MNTPKQDLILIVDDDSTNLKVLFRFLKESGFKVLVAKDGESAIEKLQEISPDLILLDVRMPGIDGFETCCRLKASAVTKDIPVIFMTVLSETVDKLKGLSLGAVDYITKPFQQEEVLARVRLHLKMRNLTKTLEEQNVLLKQEIEARFTAEAALQKLTQELEQRVQERTAELTNTLHDLQQTQVQLLQSEALLRTVVTNAPIILYAINSEGVITLLEGKGLEALGQKPGQSVGQSAFNLSCNYPWLFENIRCILAGTEGQEGQWIADMGNVVYENRATPLRNEKGQVIGLIGVATDITERKLAEEQLRRSEERLHLALETAHMGCWDWNLQTGMVAWSSHLKRLYNLSLNTLEQTYETFVTIVHPEDRDRVRQADRRCFEIGEKLDVEFRAILPDGRIRWIERKGQTFYDETGKPLRVAGIDIDITERKQAEEVQRQTQAQLQRLVEANLIGVIFADFSGNITEANDAFLEMVGYTREELRLGKVRWIDMTPPEYAEDDAKAREQIRLTGACTPHEKEYIRKDGSPVAILTGSALIEGSDQNCVSFVLDLTWRKQAEAQIRESLREKEVLLQEIHHRVKNNLQVISSLLDLQSQHIEEQATLELFRESCNRIRAMALVHEALYKFKDFAKINFAEYIENLVSYLFPAYGVNVENINLELNLDEVTLKLDTAIPCGLIINELVSNALKHAFPNKAKGIIYIDLHFGEDKYYTLTIRDNGIGLPCNWEVKAVNSLGLKLVEILAKQLEGTLQVNSHFGTEFSLRFSELS